MAAKCPKSPRKKGAKRLDFLVYIDMLKILRSGASNEQKLKIEKSRPVAENLEY